MKSGEPGLQRVMDLWLALPSACGGIFPVPEVICSFTERSYLTEQCFLLRRDSFPVTGN